MLNHIVMEKAAYRIQYKLTTTLKEEGIFLCSQKEILSCCIWVIVSLFISYAICAFNLTYKRFEIYPIITSITLAPANIAQKIPSVKKVLLHILLRLEKKFFHFQINPFIIKPLNIDPKLLEASLYSLSITRKSTTILNLFYFCSAHNQFINKDFSMTWRNNYTFPFFTFINIINSNSVKR